MESYRRDTLQPLSKQTASSSSCILAVTCRVLVRHEAQS